MTTYSTQTREPCSRPSEAPGCGGTPWHRVRRTLFLPMLALLLLGGCASKLPTQVERPVSTAIQPSANAPLVQTMQARKQRESPSGTSASGFSLLIGPQPAYGVRLALVQSAQRTLDLQYYAIHADASTERLMRAIVDAAKRGVRVRILLDDFHGTGRNALVMRMAFVPNVQMRMFNPLPGDRESSLSRMWHAATDFQRAQQRMHNKLFLADNVMGVMGGRNLGDSYFGNATSNFIDSDVLIAGPLVQDLSRSFDEYWNNQRAYPVQSLIAKDELDRMRRNFAQQDAASQAPGDTRTDASPTSGSPVPLPPDGEPRPTARNPVTAEQRAQAWDMRATDLQRIPLVWANAVVLADQPSKIPAVNADGDTDLTSAQPATLTSRQGSQILHATGGRKPPPERESALPESVVDGLVSLIAHARKDLLIVSPYFVPGERMMEVFKQAVARGVRVRILTNSLASNDAPVAHIGYARYREALLENGVQLYELMSDMSNLRAAFGLGSAGKATPQEERAMLHSKMLVMDGKLTVIGSMNLDMRSQLQNTEIAVLVRSNALSSQTAAMIERGMSQGSWHVVLEDGRLVWKAPEGSGLKDETTEPDTTLPLRMLLKIIAPMVPDSVL